GRVISTMREESSLSNQTLQKSSEQADLLQSLTVIKNGGFGQPVAMTFSTTGAFFGHEYPASVNTLKTLDASRASLECSVESGMKVGKDPVETDWVVEGLTPTLHVKDWFFRYLDGIRVAPARPYTLYNSWYDLRSPEYPKVEPAHVMNEKNILNIIHLFRKNMIEKHDIRLDAFVLDDGWDVYESDWALRKDMFPNGLKPIADSLKTMGTALGIWIGPTGGYSFRSRRLAWMKDHGYEITGKGIDYAMLCMGGKNYSALFKKRATDFVRNDGVGYFKWDGIQFSCSEPDHGHPVGIYSRKAILDSLISKCKAVRAINPNTYLNITSGTWLSPWWLKYANQIWMQGADYGYADVPSISERDAAITYKDFVLYDDFHNQDCWFPVSNLMTHGIIKGNLERLGGKDDPLNKFTNDVMFYLARGISMYELYVSPDLLTEDEWNAMGSSLSWAKDRFDILSKTFMIGGDPANREAYGYVHFNGAKGILALRNPAIEQANITVNLSAEYGLDPFASNLVLEKVYPYHWISPKLYSAGSTIDIPLDGFEAAVYELYPLQNATEPLPCGIRFDSRITGEKEYTINVYDAPLGIRLLNPFSVKEAVVGNTKADLSQLSIPVTQSTPAVTTGKIRIRKVKTGTEFTQDLTFDPSVTEVRYAILLKPDKEFENAEFPSVTFYTGEKETQPIIQQQKGMWAWYSMITGKDLKNIRSRFVNNPKSKEWKGKAAVYMILRQKESPTTLILTTNGKIISRPMPPKPFGEGIREKTVKSEEFRVEVNP
ncbi:MAG: alpha-galactosidase, partial [Bacteroidota bacterium]|nr:alpha-galactosidase [Bacteroidota bacterium]